jgi:hypothetical protein
MPTTLRLFPLAASRVAALGIWGSFHTANGIEPRFEPRHAESMDGAWKGWVGRRTADGKRSENVY